MDLDDYDVSSQLTMRSLLMVSLQVGSTPLGVFDKGILSPYLFLLCAQAISSLLTRADSSGELLRAPTSKKGFQLNHLFFFFLSMIVSCFAKLFPYIDEK